MSANEFWEDDVTLTVAYRKARKMHVDFINQQAWLQGRYIYEALLLASPAFRDLTKPGTKPGKYRDAPYELFQSFADRESATTERKEKAEMEKGLAYMTAAMAEFNKKFNPKGG